MSDDYSVVQFGYRNHRGESTVRTVRPIKLWFGSTGFHPEAQWFLEAWDLDRQATRDFAMSGMESGWTRYQSPLAAPPEEVKP